MTSMRAVLDQATNRVMFFLLPFRTRWARLEARPRALVMIGTALLVAGLILAFIWLPAVRMRDALTARLPQLEAQLDAMRKQAGELAAIAREPMPPMTTRRAADIGSLQSIFGADARISVAQDEFKIMIPAVSYANWWDKTGEAVSRHALVLKEASLVRADGPAAGASVISVDMRLGNDVGGMGPAATAVPAAQIK